MNTVTISQAINLIDKYLGLIIAIALIITVIKVALWIEQYKNITKIKELLEEQKETNNLIVEVLNFLNQNQTNRRP